MGRVIDSMVISVKYYVCIYTLMWCMQYLLFVTYVFYALILFLGWRLSIERVVAQPLHLYLFPLGVNSIGGLHTCILICNSFRLCICTLDLNMQVLNYVIHS